MANKVIDSSKIMINSGKLAKCKSIRNLIEFKILKIIKNLVKFKNIKSITKKIKILEKLGFLTFNTRLAFTQ